MGNQAPGSTGPSLFSNVGGTNYTSTDGGATWHTITADVPNASPSAPGLMSAALAASLANAGAGVASFSYWVDVDVTKTGATQITPVVAGYTFVITRMPVTVLSVTGTATTALTVNLGNNSPSYNNTISASTVLPSAAEINLGPGSSVYVGPTTPILGSALPEFVNVTTPVAGATACVVRYQAQGYWMPTSF